MASPPMWIPNGMLGRNKLDQSHAIVGILCLLISYQLLKHDIWSYVTSQPFADFQYPLDIDMPTTVETVQKRINPWAQRINDPKYPFVLNPDTKCRTEDGADENVYILLLIKSRVNHFELRRMIRRTWALETAVPFVNIRRVFLLGVSPGDRIMQHKIGVENQDYNDIIQQYFMDHYFNNTLKVMMGLQWAQAHCPSAQFVAFFDDDYYVNIFKVVQTLQAVKPKDFTNTIISYIWKNAVVLRDSRMENWTLSPAEYPYRYYPPYPTAGSFIMHMSMAERLYIAMRYTQYLRFDDIFLGIVAWKLKVRLEHNPELHFQPLPYSPFRYEEVLAVHGFDDVEVLYKVWKEQYQLQKATRRNKFQ